MPVGAAARSAFPARPATRRACRGDRTGQAWRGARGRLLRAPRRRLPGCLRPDRGL